MNWKEVIVKINNQGTEAVASIMNELGSNGVVYNEVDNRSIISAYYPNDKTFPELIKELRNRVHDLVNFSLDTGNILIIVEDLDNEDWATNWQQYFRPLKIGREFIVCPGWEIVEESKRIIIRIDPGMAFGVGSHESTSLCLEFLEEYIDPENRPETMLDIGTGTGILAIAAALLGVDKIIGIDIDPHAVEAAKKNIRLNSVEDKIQIQKGDMTEDLGGKFSIITANLLPDLILKLLPSVPPLMSADTYFILSGIILNKRDIIINKLKDLNLKVIDEKLLNDWVSLIAVRE